MKNGKNTHSGHFLETCTGTISDLVIFDQLVPVQPVLVFLFRPVFVFLP